MSDSEADSRLVSEKCGRGEENRKRLAEGDKHSVLRGISSDDLIYTVATVL